jgi:D-glycero-D-manno-heptose 1,7-bisphosphate phosphatase
MAARATLIVLDRDGVLNRLIDNPAEARPDSPLTVADVELLPWVPAALRDLTRAGFGLAIASNQPASAKGKPTRTELEAVHAAVLAGAQSAGGIILSSHLCFHREDDGCGCRKPATGLLVEAFARHPAFRVDRSWMDGDRAPDVLAGASHGLRTALLAADGANELAALAARGVRPSFQGRDLRDFADFVIGSADV